MKIEHLEVEELKEYENNAKEHPQEQVQQIADSIEEFGFNDPIDFEIALVHNRGNHIQADRGSAVWQYQDKIKKDFILKQKKNNLQDLLLKIVDGETIWRVKKDNTAQYLHPTQKPVEINEKALINFTQKGDIVVDFFLGSGSNMIACENLDRKCYGMELDTKYAQTIIERYTEYTSIDTIKINGKEVSWNDYKEA